MKVDKITYQKVFPLSPYVNEKIGIEIQIDEESGDNPTNVFAIAKAMVETWHKQSNPEPVKESPLGEIPIINRRDETLLALIEDAKNMDELNNYHAPAQSSNNAKVMEAYAVKLNSLKKSKQ